MLAVRMVDAKKTLELTECIIDLTYCCYFRMASELLGTCFTVVASVVPFLGPVKAVCSHYQI